MPIKLSSGILTIQKINKPTKAVFFKDIHEGDQIEITHVLASTTGASGGGKYASYFKLVNYSRLNSKTTISGNDLMNRLQNFEVKAL